MRNRKQHTVPACYLENFTDSKGRLFVRREHGIYISKPEAILTDNHFYTVKLDGGGGSFAVEGTLAHIEGRFARIYRDRISKYEQMTAEERFWIAVFIAAMLLRTRSNRAAHEGMIKDMRSFVDEMMRLPPEKRPRSEPGSGESIPVEVFFKAAEDMNTFHAASIMGSLEQATGIIYQMTWGFFVAAPDLYFVTSDNPVNFSNLEFFKEHGTHGMQTLWMLGHDGAELAMPMSSSITWLGGWKMHVDQKYIEVGEESVDSFRARAVESAFKEVIARERGYLETINYSPEGRPPEAAPTS